MPTHGYDPTLTPLQIVEKAAAYLLNLEEPCVNEWGACTYRGPNGSACAVGHVISDKLAQLVEGETLCRPHLFESEIPEEAVPFLLRLQLSHDNWALERDVAKGKAARALERDVAKVLEKARTELS